MFYIIEIRKFYGPSTKRIPVLDHDTDQVEVFRIEANARNRVAQLNEEQYALAHNQYGYDYQVHDLRKPRNRRWLRRWETLR